MNKKLKIAIWVSAALAVIIGLFSLCYFVLQIPLLDGSGWHSPESGGKMYLDYYGKPMPGWVELEDGWYYFDEETCLMHTGWLEQDGNIFYIAPDGKAHTGWLETQEGRQYFSVEDRVMHTGWLELEDGRYYMAESGLMYTGWLTIGEEDYYLDPNTGAMRTGWLKLEDDTYYLDETGVRCVGWAEVDGLRYFFEEDGQMRTGWLHSEDGTYYLTETGAAQTGWYTTPNARYYMHEDGRMATGFVTVDGVERYFQENGWYTPVVNRENYVPDDYKVKLVEVEGFLVDETCSVALKSLIQAAREAGFEVVINSAYRDEEKQMQVWEEYRTGYLAEGLSEEEAEKLTAAYVAVPGTSEHHLGLAIDFGNRGTIYEWLAENSWQYGFILRYLKDNDQGAYEPWHFRYVGINMAKDVYESGIMLEKYLESLK